MLELTWFGVGVIVAGAVVARVGWKMLKRYVIDKERK